MDSWSNKRACWSLQPQLQLQLGQIKSLTGKELGIGQAQQLFSLGVEIEILVDALHDRGLGAGDSMNFLEKIVQSAVHRGEEDQLARPVRQIWNDRRRFQ